jgi:hypothetical protein
MLARTDQPILFHLRDKKPQKKTLKSNGEKKKDKKTRKSKKAEKQTTKSILWQNTRPTADDCDAPPPGKRSLTFGLIAPPS